MTARGVRRLTLALATWYAALGTLQVVLQVVDESTIAFFGGTLLGGAALILRGLYAHVLGTTHRVLVRSATKTVTS